METIKPDVFVMSDTSRLASSREKRQRELVTKYGGKIIMLPEMTDEHTTAIIERVKTL